MMIFSKSYSKFIPVKFFSSKNAIFTEHDFLSLHLDFNTNLVCVHIMHNGIYNFLTVGVWFIT